MLIKKDSILNDLNIYLVCIVVFMEVVGYPNYLIYDDGRVYGKTKNTFLKPYTTNTGYEVVDLFCNGKRKKFLVHRLVALHYLEKIEGLEIVDHIDQNKKNNNVSNLRFSNKSLNGYNRGSQCNNKLGHKNIFFCNTHKVYIHKVKVNGKSKSKRFKTLEECIQYKNNFHI